MADDRRFTISIILAGIVSMIFAAHEGRVVEALVAWPVIGGFFFMVLGNFR